MRIAADRLSIRWYLGYTLDEALPDHSSLTRIRSRYGLEVFRRFFEAIVEQCQHAGLVWGRELYFDATQVQADAALESLTTRFAVEARAPLQAHLAGLFPEETSLQVPQATAGQEHLAAAPSLAPATPATPLPVVLSALQREDLAATNAARHDWIAEEGRQQREVHGIRQRTADVRISTTDPDATPMRLKGGGTHLGYQTHYVVDGGKARIIVGVLVTPGEVSESQPMRDLLWRARFRWKLRVRQVTGDTKYGTTENIRAVEDMGIRAYMPLPDWEKNSPISAPPASATTPSTTTMSARTDRCSAAPTSRRQGSAFNIGHKPRAVAPVPLKWRVRRVQRWAARSGAPLARSTWSAYRPTSRLPRTRRRCGSARSGLNRGLPRPKSGMAHAVSVCVGCGASTVRPS
jgi:hypothetical protein